MSERNNNDIERMQVGYLTSDEVEYELTCRAAYIDTDESVQESARGETLHRWLIRDKTENKTPLQWVRSYTDAQASDELNRCKPIIGELQNNVTGVVHTRDTQALEQNESRLIHYYWRLKRMGENELQDETRQLLEADLVTVNQALKVAYNLRQIYEIIQTAPPSGTDRGTDEANIGIEGLHSTFNNSNLADLCTPQRESHPNRTESELAVTIKNLINMYEPVHTEVMAWMTNGKATMLEMRNDNLLLDGLFSRWHLINGQIPDNDEELVGRLSVLFRRMLLSRRWLNEELKRQETSLATHTQGQAAHSTLHQQYQQSVNALVSQIDGMSLDDSMESNIPTIPNAATGNITGVRFERSQRDANRTITAAQQPRSILQSTTTRTTNNIDSQRTGENNPINRSRVWPRPEPNSEVETERQMYHPSIASRMTVNRDEQPRMSLLQATEGNVSMGAPMSLGTIQQQMSRYFSNRKYNGKTADGHKTMSADEFMGCLRSIKMSMGINEAIILSSLPIFLSEPAYQWWITNEGLIRTLDELEEQVKIRFEKRRMDPWSQRMDFASRKQGSEEYIADYIDEMCRRAYGIRPRLEEDQIMQVIIDNANITCK